VWNANLGRLSPTTTLGPLATWNVYFGHSPQEPGALDCRRVRQVGPDGRPWTVQRIGVNPWIVTISAMMATFMIDKEFQSVMKPRPGSLFASVRL
jgi:hypothetical protein